MAGEAKRSTKNPHHLGNGPIRFLTKSAPGDGGSIVTRPRNTAPTAAERMLLLLLLLHNAIASDFSEDANYTLKRISSCPDEGYFFQQAFGLNELDPSLCYICFCKTDGIAVCWRRSGSRCDRKSHRSEDRRVYRPRRSSVVTEIPQKNSPAKFYSQRSSYDCKPIGSSLSKGCPPDDWCLGCTLCDCDVSGRWSCHILSFCSDKKAPKQIENRNDTLKRRPVKIHPKANVNTNTPKVHKYVKKLHTSHKCNKCLKSSSHEFSMAKQEFGLPRHDDTVVVIEKDLVGRTPMEVQGVRVKKVIHDNSSNIKLAHKIVQRAMAAVHKIINMNERNSTNVTKLFKVLQKRSMSLRDDYASHQSDYMSPHMYKKPSPRRFRKKISVNNIKIDNNSGRKKRVRRNIPNEGNATQGRIPRDFNNSLSETPLNEESTIRQLNKYEYVRTKRSTMRDDDAIEYLLMLMEYLLKQNYPLDAAPVNDGIDLLIDAIKHAPDIKPIKKKVLHSPMTRVPVSRTTPRVTAETFSYVDNIYGIDSLEKDVNDTSHSEDNQVIFSPVIDGDDKMEDFHKLLQNSKKISNPFKMLKINTGRDHGQLDFMTTTSTSIITTTPLIRYDFYKENTARPVEMVTSIKTDKHSDEDEKYNSVEHIKSNKNEADRKIQSEIEEYSSNLILVTEPDSFLITFPTRTEPVITTTTRKFHHMTKEKFEDPETMTYKRKNTKSKFGWIDYDQEENVSKLVQRKSAVRTTITTNTPKKQTDVNDISSITEEIMDETSKKHFSKMLPSSVFDKLNLMHSNEYGTKKSEIGSESKEIEQEDTYVNDIFPSYFT
ncbi:unnamed protein product, partial [Iphiclides podalirius]